jgi:catechol 2,3-dioxygenase-like lactoylglutathione lyase family enzyme
MRMASNARLATLVPIRDMDRAIKFYTKKLGAKLEFRGQGEMKDGWAWIKVAGTDIWLISPEKREKRTLAYSTFLVKDIKGFVSGLQKKGVKFAKATKMSKETRVEGPIAFETFGASAFFNDSEGNLYMVWQDTVAM